MTLDAVIEHVGDHVDAVARRHFVRFARAVDHWDPDDRAAALRAWRSAWAAQRFAALDQLREYVRLVFDGDTVH